MTHVDLNDKLTLLKLYMYCHLIPNVFGHFTEFPVTTLFGMKNIHIAIGKNVFSESSLNVTL